MIKSAFKNIFVYSLALFCLLPFCIMIVNSFKIMNGFGIEQYVRALFQTDLFLRGFWNSVLYTVVIIAVNIPVSLLAAYGFTYFDFKGKFTMFWAYIVLMLMPFQATIVPQYLTLKALGILDTANAVILPNIFSTFGTFLIAQYMKGLDKELLEAGKMDGLSEFGLMIKLAMPMCKAIFSALIVLLFINYWSMVEQPIIFLSNNTLFPLSVTLNESGVFRNIFFACGVIFTVLPLLLYLLCYDDLIKGIAVYSSAVTRANTEDKNKKVWNKKSISKSILIFAVFMAACTLITQKVTHIMTAEVEVVTPYQGDLKAEYNSKDSESLGYFGAILPKECVFKGQDDSYVYLVSADRSNANKLRAVKTTVRIRGENEMEYAVEGGVHYKSDVILFKSKQIMDGSYIRIGAAQDNNMKGMTEFTYAGQDESGGFRIEDIKFLEDKYILDYETDSGGVYIKRLSVSSKEENCSRFFKEQLFSDIANNFDYNNYVIKDFTENERVLSEFKNIYIFLMQLLGFIVICYLMVNILSDVISFYKKQSKYYYFNEIIDINATELLICAIKAIILFFTGVFLLREIVDFQFFILGEYIPADYILDFKFYHNAFMMKKELAVNYLSDYENLYIQAFNKNLLFFAVSTIISSVIAIFATKKLKPILCKIKVMNETVK